MLDAGCGAGRLALMCAVRACRVVGVDFAESAIWIARLNARACGIDNVQYVVEDLDGHQSVLPYDVVTLVGTLEHVPDPVETLRQINGHLRMGGTAVVSCPNFLNFRGHTYMTLLTLFGLPMSLADVRQVSYLDMRGWAAQTGFELVRTVGAFYRFAWDQKSVDDMIKRVPAALRDKDLGIPVDLEAYSEWLRSQVEVNRAYLSGLENRGLLKRISRKVGLHPRPLEGVDSSLWERMVQYLNEDTESDPYYSDVEPFCYQGGEGIYLLRKVSELS